MGKTHSRQPPVVAQQVSVNTITPHEEDHMSVSQATLGLMVICVVAYLVYRGSRAFRKALVKDLAAGNVA